MIKGVKLAKINLTMQSGRIVRWLKKEGDRIERDQPLLEVETDKAVNTVESFHGGYLKKILVPEGEEVPVDTLIAWVGDLEDEVPAGLPASPGTQAASRVINASPLARRLASELGVDLTTISGSGPHGRIGKEDVMAATQSRSSGRSAGAQGAAAPVVPLAGLKKTTADRMKASYLDAPHIHLDLSIEAGALEALRSRLNAGPGVGARPARQAAGERAEALPADKRFTLTDLLVRAVSLALADNPLLNASYREGGIAVFDEQGIGIAVSSPRGLVVPVIRGCQALGLPQIRDRRRELVARARQGCQTAEDLTGGTFTISNLGMLGVDAFRPILYPGQAGILAVGALRSVAVPDRAGGFTAKAMIQLTLGCDHRVVDGAEGAAFLRRLRQLLEDPSRLTAGDEET
jgi:pyruvate dehydrogenase E2 component (dihydrolipoamide acetyltransferase)